MTSDQMRIFYLEKAVQEIHRVVDQLAASIMATQRKLGVDGSDDPKSIDYRVRALEKK